LKVYELKKGDKLIYKDEIIEFEEIRGDKAIFYNDLRMEIEFPDYLDIDEIGEFLEHSFYKSEENSPTLF